MRGAALRDHLGAWRQGFLLAFGLHPSERAVLVGIGPAISAMTLSLLVFAAVDRWLAGSPATFWHENLMLHAGYFLCVLLVAALACRGLGRPAMSLTLATMWLLATIPWTAACQYLVNESGDGMGQALWAAFTAVGLGTWLVLARCLGHIAPEVRMPRRWLLATISFALLALPWQQRQDALLWGDDHAPSASIPSDETDIAADDGGAAPAPSVLHAQSLLAAQSALLAHEVEKIRVQTPGQVDLFAIGFAGDSVEPVFRNEVDYLKMLLSGRFGAEDRALPLVNSFDTVAYTPLASLENLRAGLKQVAAKMDLDEDVLLLFLTSHGSDDHELLVDLGDLPMQQVTPSNLRSALDASGIRWRVVVVSACYSGGFVPALQEAHTLVITAARSDRTSFGCGSDSEITWFGKAYLENALNETTDFRAAFTLARKQIRDWEREDNNTPSWPQISEGRLIGAKLDALQASLPVTPPVPFVPTVPAAMPRDEEAP